MRYNQIDKTKKDKTSDKPPLCVSIASKLKKTIS